jgi:hypothetical protein
LTITIEAFVSTIGTEGRKAPYKIKNPQPIVLITLRCVMFFIKNEIKTSAEAAYPINSV